jgi:hypothetical protein
MNRYHNVVKRDLVASLCCSRPEYHQAGAKRPDEKLAEKVHFPPHFSPLLAGEQQMLPVSLTRMPRNLFLQAHYRRCRERPPCP